MKYHYSDRFFTYLVRRNGSLPARECLLFLGLSSGGGVRGVGGCGAFRGAFKSLPGVHLRRPRCACPLLRIAGAHCDPLRGQNQVGSLTGAVHLSNDNAGVLRPAQRGQKPRVEQKGKCWLDPDFQYEYGLRKQGLSILLTL